MAVTDTPDLIEWRARMAHALKRSFDAAVDYAPATRIRELEQLILVLEHEGRTRGFLPDAGSGVRQQRQA